MDLEFDRKLGANFMESVPDASGVYIFRDAKGDPLYVGKAKNLRRRLAQYRNAPRKKQFRKMRAIVRKAASLEFQICASEKAALLLENQLIQLHRPALNVAGAYAFLYPYLGLKTEHEDRTGRFLTLCSTTSPDILKQHGFELFGAFRSRDMVSEAYEALAFLLPFISHHTPAERKRYGDIPYTRIIGFRQLDPKWAVLFQSFFRGESQLALECLVQELLEKVDARHAAAAVQDHLRHLKYFFGTEAVKLRSVLDQHGISASMIRQEERDRLFLSLV